MRQHALRTHHDLPGQKKLWIDEFSVHPDYQRQGVGSRMLAYLRQERLKEPKPINHMALITTHGFPSVAFYEKNGFVGQKDELVMAGHVNWP